MFAQHNRSTIFNKPSLEELTRNKAKGKFNATNDNKFYAWKPSVKRVDDYFKRPKIDDFNAKRGVKMVQSPATKSRNPIDGGFGNNFGTTKPSKKRQAPEISAEIKKVNDLKSFALTIERSRRKIPAERLLYKSTNKNK